MLSNFSFLFIFITLLSHIDYNLLMCESKLFLFIKRKLFLYYHKFNNSYICLLPSKYISMCEFVFYRVYIFHAMYAVLAHQYRYNYRSITTLFLVVCTSTLSSGSTFKIGCSFLSIPSNVFNSPNLAFFSVIHPDS